jgi:hypothetical protein
MASVDLDLNIPVRGVTVTDDESPSSHTITATGDENTKNEVLARAVMLKLVDVNRETWFPWSSEWHPQASVEWIHGDDEDTYKTTLSCKSESGSSQKLCSGSGRINVHLDGSMSYCWRPTEQSEPQVRRGKSDGEGGATKVN